MDLETAINLAKIAEISKNQIQQLQEPSTVSKVIKKKLRKRKTSVEKKRYAAKSSAEQAEKHRCLR